MREIVFRGKRLDNGEWVTGYYVRLHDPLKKKESHRIYIGYAEAELDGNEYLFYPDYFDVDPATVGQFTGLKDKNGKMIFEGDIVLKRVRNGKREPRLVEFSRGCFHCGFGGGSSTPGHPYTLDDNQIEVIGSIYDNPELLVR